jgi:hypothetical protein
MGYSIQCSPQLGTHYIMANRKLKTKNEKKITLKDLIQIANIGSNILRVLTSDTISLIINSMKDLI